MKSPRGAKPQKGINELSGGDRDGDMEGTATQNDFSIVLAGEAGQGIQSIETIIVALARAKGYHVYATKEYMSRVRGGMNSTSIRISTAPVDAPIERIDIAIPLSPEGLPHLKKRLTKKTALIVDGSLFPKKTRAMMDVPLAAIAGEIGGAIYANTVAAGVICAIIGVDEEAAEAFVAERFAKKGEPIPSLHPMH